MFGWFKRKPKAPLIEPRLMPKQMELLLEDQLKDTLRKMNYTSALYTVMEHFEGRPVEDPDLLDFAGNHLCRTAWRQMKPKERAINCTDEKTTF